MTEHGSLAREGGQWNHIEMKRLEIKTRLSHWFSFASVIPSTFCEKKEAPWYEFFHHPYFYLLLGIRVTIFLQETFFPAIYG